MIPAAMLARGLADLRIFLPDGAEARLLAYLELLLKWNKTYNLTAIREPGKMVTHHLLDSLAVVPYLAAGPIADIGSGAGLPGIPLAIAQPERPISLNDSGHKKATFLKQAVTELGLGNVTVVNLRAEDWQPREKFACVISRAFAELADFLNSSRHLVRRGGQFAAMKGVYPHEELARLPSGFRCDKVVVLDIPLVAAERHLVLCHRDL
ncbi:MAG: 16S rRNA (guanine(527)-N(7))-methyltransferase RsmG [Betaproteobacteria bacterium]|nr:16S rRNA (guanine(527)-N(7))-methyltransferase RsmG [Betaproteobacteria bacterium]